MRVLITPAIIALLTFGAGGLWAQQPNAPAPPDAPIAQQGPAIRRNVNLVNVLFTVENQKNKIVSDLEQKDFKVFDDNAQQAIQFFSRQTDLPLRVGLL